LTVYRLWSVFPSFGTSNSSTPLYQSHSLFRKTSIDQDFNRQAFDKIFTRLYLALNDERFGFYPSDPAWVDSSSSAHQEEELQRALDDILVSTGQKLGEG